MTLPRPAPTPEKEQTVLFPSNAELTLETHRDEAFGTISSSELLQGLRCIQIDHNGTVYRLQATRLGKLILTK